MASTYEKIATTTLGSAISTVNFNSITASYTDLIFVWNIKQDSDSSLYMRFNGDTNSNYSTTGLFGDGTSATSQRLSNNSNGIWFRSELISGSNFNPIIYQFNNYSNTNVFKTVISRANNAAEMVGATVGLWRSTSAINSIEIWQGTEFSAGSTFTLYGIKAA
jgi:hypothetical protein